MSGQALKPDGPLWVGGGAGCLLTARSSLVKDSPHEARWGGLTPVNAGHKKLVAIVTHAPSPLQVDHDRVLLNAGGPAMVRTFSQGKFAGCLR